MIRVLVVGAGSIGARHAGHVIAHPACDLVGVVDPDPARAGAHGARAFTSIQAVDVPVDAAIIATPTDSHAALGIAAAARGWAVLVEKPIADDLAEADRLIAACAAADVPLIVGHHRRTHKVVQRAREIIASGALGRLVGVSAIWAVRKPDGYHDVPWRAGPGGSPILINLVHDIDILRFMVGEIAEVAPLLSDSIRGGATEDSGALAIRFTSGALGTVLFSDHAASPWGFEAGTGENVEIAASGEDCYRFVGTEGSLGFPSLTLFSGARNWAEPQQRQTEEIAVTVPLVAQLDHLCEVVEHSAAPLCSGADGREALRWALEIAAERGT